MSSAVAAENSGKLVSVVRKKAVEVAEKTGREMVIIDGPPGIGCAVIASIAGTDFVLAVTEPTLSAEHDMERVLLLSRHFGIRSAVVVNKWDLNPEAADRIEGKAVSLNAMPIGRIGYDPAMVAAQIEGRTVVEFAAGSAIAGEVRDVWESLWRIAV